MNAVDEEVLFRVAPQEGVAIGLRHPANFPPGQAFGCSGTNDLLLGLLVEQVTGQCIPNNQPLPIDHAASKF